MGMTRTLQVTNGWLPMVAAVLALAGCGSDDASVCGTATLPEGGITAVDTSQTPRANRAAELLALETSGEFVAPTPLYERVAGDLTALRGQWPDKTHGFVLGCGGLLDTQIIVGMTEAGTQLVQNGQYTAWDEYNQTLRAAVDPKDYGAVLRFDGVYNYASLAQAYRQLPEVTYVEPDALIGGSADICLEREQDAADTHVYIFWAGSGDCPSGCINQEYHGFTSTAAGGLTELGSYTYANGLDNPPAPRWFDEARQCRAFLYNQP